MRQTIAKLSIYVMIATGVMSAVDLRLGTWKFNTVKSKSTASNPVASQIDIREAMPDGRIQVTRKGKLKDGKDFGYSLSFKYDGREYPVKGAAFDTIAVKRIDALTTSYEASVTKVKSKYSIKGITLVTQDGRTLTQTSKGIDETGKLVESTAVFDRQ